MRPVRLLRRVIHLAAAAAAAALLAPASAPAVPASVGIAALNAQREANGIPGGIVEDPAWSVGCDHHISYLQANGGNLTHDELRGRPGYTADGDSAGNSSVLSLGDSWTTGNPWETAPIHLHQLLGPRLSVTGVADRDRYVCMVTWPGYQRPAPADWITYTYPGPGVVGYAFEETAFESPFTPGEKVGIPQGTKTGAYLYVMFDGPFDHATARTTAASLTGPDGPVAIAVVDNDTPDVGGYLPPGMELIPRRPLRPRTTYTASIAASLHASTEFAVLDQPVEHTWSFTTSGRPNSASVRVQRDQRHPTFLKVRVDSEAPHAVLTVTRPDGTTVQPTLRHRVARVQAATAGRWRFCATSGGDATEYEAAQRCVTRSFATTVDFALPTRVRHGRLRLNVPPALVGRHARVDLWAYTMMGRARARHTVRLKRHTILAMPTIPGAIRWWVDLRVRRFQRGATPYGAIHLNRAYDHIT
ncbi:MAG TPA: hypothetical protein VFT50_17105 [Baekduia sp.]|nr:hypothetical protein [Baekduia sp.]